MSNNNENLRSCEADWLDPESDSYVNAYKGGVEFDDDYNIALCEFHDGYVFEHEILDVGGFRICEDCASEIVEAWNKRYGGK